MKKIGICLALATTVGIVQPYALSQTNQAISASKTLEGTKGFVAATWKEACENSTKMNFASMGGTRGGEGMMAIMLRGKVVNGTMPLDMYNKIKSWFLRKCPSGWYLP